MFSDLRAKLLQQKASIEDQERLLLALRNYEMGLSLEHAGGFGEGSSVLICQPRRACVRVQSVHTPGRSQNTPLLPEATQMLSRVCSSVVSRKSVAGSYFLPVFVMHSVFARRAMCVPRWDKELLALSASCGDSVSLGSKQSEQGKAWRHSRRCLT
jgi:hypothetical protein